MGGRNILLGFGKETFREMLLLRILQQKDVWNDVQSCQCKAKLIVSTHWWRWKSVYDSPIFHFVDVDAHILKRIISLAANLRDHSSRDGYLWQETDTVRLVLPGHLPSTCFHTYKMLLFYNIVELWITKAVHGRRECNLILTTTGQSYSVLCYGLCLTYTSTSLCIFCHKRFYRYSTS